MHEVVLGRYRLIGRLGVGGSAEVWRASDGRGGPDVALKRLLPGRLDDPSMVERLRREALASASIRHPNIVRTLDAGRGVAVFELVDGEPLSTLMQRGPMPATVVERLALEVADALAAVHAAGLVHGDLTPANILVDHEGHAHVTDIGGGPALAGQRIGTPGYLAPERLQGELATAASDIWALGAVLHEALSGVPLPAVHDDAAPRLGTRALATLIAEMLAPPPARRPTAAAVVRSLAPGPMAVTEPLPGSLAGAVAPRTGPVPRVPPRGPDRIRPARLGLVGVAGALLAAGLVLAAARPAEPLSARDAAAPATGAPSPGPTTRPAGPSSSASPTPTPAASNPAQRAAPRPRQGRPHAHGKPHDRGGRSHGGPQGPPGPPQDRGRPGRARVRHG